MTTNAFLSFFDKADGESIQRGKEKWIEIQGWNWEVEAETSSATGSGMRAGKVNPGRIMFEHRFNTASPVILGYLCTGKVFPKCELQMTKASDRGSSDPYFTMKMEDVVIAKVSNAGTEDGNVSQRVEMVFKTVTIEYRSQDIRTGSLNAVKTFNWDIHTGTAFP